MKLELKHIAPYLPYGLKVTFESDEYKHFLAGLNIYDRGCMLVSPFNDSGDAKISDCKPLLLPLSAIAEQLPDGSVPIVELAKIAYPKDSKFELTNGYVDLGLDYSFHFLNDAVSFDCRRSYNGKRWDYNCYVPHQLQLFEYLYQHHFDVYGLIDAGLAIDKRTLNQ